MASNVPDRFTVTPSAGHIAWGRELAVPAYSQEIHDGHYPEYDNGGEAWCSPTSTAMVARVLGRRPVHGRPRLGRPGLRRPAGRLRGPRDVRLDYDGAGNWPFNTAYAGYRARRVRDPAALARRRSSASSRPGIPVVASQSFSPPSWTARTLDPGHLFVIVGFTATGDVIVNDPASWSNDVVRNVYKRSQFEQVWLRTKRLRANGTVAGGSGGIAYLIKPWWKPWPKVAGSQNW